MLKYWKLYWKDIEDMAKSELCEHIVNAYSQLAVLTTELEELKEKLFLAENTKKSWIQRLFNF